MTLNEALNRINFYLFIILSLSIISFYAGPILSIELLKEHLVLAFVLEALFIVVNTFILYNISKWCYRKKWPRFFFNYLKNRSIGKRRNKFNELFNQDNDNIIIKGYIDNSVNVIKSNGEKDKIILALDQLIQWIDEDEEIQRHVLNKLAECIRSDLDEDILRAILSVLCTYNRKINGIL